MVVPSRNVRDGKDGEVESHTFVVLRFYLGSKPCLVSCQRWGLPKWRHKALLLGP